jgi:uncharacterized integral membrane protein
MVIARRLILMAVTAAVLIGGWHLATQNAQPVIVDYGVGVTTEVPLWAAMVAAFGAGALLVSLYALYRAMRAGLVARRYRVAIQGLEAEVHQLRNLPLAGEERIEDDVVSALHGGETPVG